MMSVRRLAWSIFAATLAPVLIGLAFLELFFQPPLWINDLDAADVRGDGGLLFYLTAAFLQLIYCFVMALAVLSGMKRKATLYRTEFLSFLAPSVIAFSAMYLLLFYQSPTARVMSYDMLYNLVQSSEGHGLQGCAIPAPWSQTCVLSVLSIVPGFQILMAFVCVSIASLSLSERMVSLRDLESRERWEEAFGHAWSGVQNHFFIAAGLLAFSAVSTAFFHQISTGLVTGAENRILVDEAALGMSAFWGGVFTAMLLGHYILAMSA